MIAPSSSERTAGDSATAGSRSRLAWSWRRPTIATSLALFGLATLVPVFAGGVILALRLARQEQQRLEAQARDVARDVAGDIDRELQGVVAALEALSTSPALSEGRFDIFYRQAQKALAFRGTAIVMRDPKGQQLVNTIVPWGTSLPVSSDPVLREADQRALATGRPVVSNLYVGAVTRKPFVLVDVPVRDADGKSVAVLDMALAPERLSELLVGSAIPPAWTVGIVDGAFRIIARSRDFERFLGATATPTLQSNVTAGNTLWRGVTLEGIPVVSTWAPSAMSDWRVAVSVPLAVVDQPLVPLMWSLAGLTGLGLASSLLLAAFAGRGLATPVRRLAEAAGALGRGQTPVLPDTSIAELGVIAAAIADAGQELKQRTRERDDALALAQDGAERLRATYDNAGAGIAEIDAQGRFLAVNETICRITGYSRDELIGRGFETLSTAEDVREDLADFERQRAGQQTSYVVEKRFRRKDGELRWARIFSSAVRQGGDAFAYAVRVVLDVTEERRAAEHQLLLVAELNHRVKNTLAVVQSLVLQTLKTSPDPHAFRQALTGRIMALARSHDLLSATDWKGTTLGEIVSLTLAPHRREDAPWSAQGPRVAVGMRSVVSLSLLLHELATNAAKYGALGPRHGRLAVRWTIEPSDPETLCIHWDESWTGDGDAPVTPGFGSRLVDLIVEQELAGRYEREFGLGFARYRFALPLTTVAR
jgi:PAS domain S-box-containing protein